MRLNFEQKLELRLREIIEAANTRFNELLQDDDCYSESDRNSFVLGWIEGIANRNK